MAVIVVIPETEHFLCRWSGSCDKCNRGIAERTAYGPWKGSYNDRSDHVETWFYKRTLLWYGPQTREPHGPNKPWRWKWVGDVGLIEPPDECHVTLMWVSLKKSGNNDYNGYGVCIRSLETPDIVLLALCLLKEELYLYISLNLM